MPNKHFYVAMGAAHGAMAAHLVRQHRHRLRQRWRWFRHFSRRHPDWYLWFPIIYVPFIIWALLPDLLHASAVLPKEVTRGPLFDLFYLHSSFERWEDQYPRVDRLLNAIGSLLLVGIGLGNFVFYVRTWHRRTGAGGQRGSQVRRQSSRMG